MSKAQYKYIYSNPRFKNKNDHDNCAGHQFEIAPKKNFQAMDSVGSWYNLSRGKKLYNKKNAFWAKYNGQKLHLGQNAMEKA